MYTINLGTEWLIVILILLNVVPAFFIRSHDRFWIPPVILSVFLFFASITVSQTNNRIIEYKQIAAEEHLEGSGPFNTYEVDENKKESHSTNKTLITLLGIQSIIGLLLQFAGLKTTGRKYYQKSTYTFLFLSVCYILSIAFVQII
jgi:hypothetical protein